MATKTKTTGVTLLEQIAGLDVGDTLNVSSFSPETASQLLANANVVRRCDGDERELFRRGSDIYCVRRATR